MAKNLFPQKMDLVIKDGSSLLDLKDIDLQILEEKSEILQKWADDIVKTFYDKLYSYPNTAKIVKKFPREALEKTLKEWYLSLLKGKPSEDFWKRQWFVGLAHIARGVDNVYMLSMMSHIQLEFGKKCFETFEKDEAWRIFEAFKKLTDVITSLIVEGYLDLYKKAIEGMSGIKPALIDRMAYLESQKMWEEYKNQRG